MTTPPVRPRALTHQAVALAVSLLDQVGVSGRLPGSAVKVGTPMEVVGDTSTTYLYPFGTSGEEGAAPYLLVHNLPLTCGVVRVPEGETGAGAWRIELDKPVADYVASGGLREFTVTD
ncbi:hypothetical protein [Nocardioides daphniae]|nr:hypothetical protein [Nocardioides daphniae]QCC76264.1 hypothetical protein E2C04_01840 [Nocardioides daphniae]